MMKTKVSSANQIIEGVIWKQLLIFFFPIMLGTLFQQLYNTVDAIIVGRFVGKEALACVGGSSGQLIDLIVNFFVGLSSGATVIISRYFGAKDARRLDLALHTSAALCIAGSILISIIGIVGSPLFLRWMNTPKDVIEGSTLYLRIYFSGILFVFIYNIGSAILRAMGDSRRPLYYLMVCCFLNIVLDLLFVVVFSFGIAGAALATVVSQGVSAILIIRNLMCSKELYRLTPKKIRFHKAELTSIITIGLPAGLQNVMYCIANVLIQVAVNRLGTDAVAANTAYSKISSFYWMISGAFSVSIATFVGQNYGAGKYSRMKRSIWVCLGMDIAASALMSIFFLLAGKQLLHLFTSDTAVIEIGMEILWIISPFYVFFPFIEIFSSALRSIGDVIIPMIMTCCGVCVMRILWICFVAPHFNEIAPILACFPISWIITAILFLFYYIIRQRQFDRKHPVDLP